MMILACLQVTRNPTDPQHKLCILHMLYQATYAMADVRGPLDTKVSPVESTLGPWISIGYENRLNTTVISFSTKAATNSLVSERGTRDKSRKVTHLLVKTTVCVSALTPIDNVTASKIAEKVREETYRGKG
jgi:hypothetical protein